jgi:hypothetical protein
MKIIVLAAFAIVLSIVYIIMFILAGSVTPVRNTK